LDEIKDKIEYLNKRFAKVKLSELIVFTRQFATLFSAGVPIGIVLERLSEQTVSIKLKDAVSIIKNDVNSGMSLSEAFSKHKDIFSALYINMLKVGEESGTLDIVLDRLASILETELDTRNKIKTATRYPKMVVSAIIIAFTIIITFVIPKFVSLFSHFGAKLPLPTRILIGINYVFHHYWWIVVLGVVGAVFVYKEYRKTQNGRYATDKYVLKIPIIGPLVHKIYVSRMVRILGLLYKSGIAIVDALEIVSNVTGNVIAKQAVSEIKKDVEGGATISVPFAKSSFFPNVVSDMVAVGEETGRLDEMLFKAADYYDEEIDYTIKNLSQAIEPILLVFIAGMVLILALGVFLPMWDMIKVVH
jgi:MSHA biogenesis protein MshG